MLFFSIIIASAQTPSSKTYFHNTASFNIDSIFVPVSKSLANTHPAYMWLNTLNALYIDTATTSINPIAVPAFHQIKKHSLLAGSQTIQKQMNAGSYYQPHFFQTVSILGSILPMNYNPINAPYPALPYGYTPYSNKATASPYYILPKY